MRQRLTGRRLSKSRYSTNFHARFVRREKSLVKKFCDKKERSFDFLPFEGKRIDFGVNKPKLRRFEIRPFGDKMRPFCTISGSTFWKIHPDVCMYECMCVCVFVYIFILMSFRFLSMVKKRRYIHTSFSGAPRGAFQQPVYNKCKVRWLRVSARPLQAVHKVFFV